MEKFLKKLLNFKQKREDKSDEDIEKNKYHFVMNLELLNGKPHKILGGSMFLSYAERAEAKMVKSSSVMGSFSKDSLIRSANFLL